MNPFQKQESKEPQKVDQKIDKPIIRESEARDIKTNTTMIAANPIDVYVAQVVESQPKTLEEVEVIAVDKYEDARHRLKLPKEIEKIFKKKGYTARWIFKDKRSVDWAIKQRGWSLVTRMFFPDLPDDLFSATGVVENGDSILGFMPNKRAEFLRSEPGRMSTERMNNLPIEKWKNGGENFYKPALTSEKDGEEITAGIQPDRIERNQE